MEPFHSCGLGSGLRNTGKAQVSVSLLDTRRRGSHGYCQSRRHESLEFVRHLKQVNESSDARHADMGSHQVALYSLSTSA